MLGSSQLPSCNAKADIEYLAGGVNVAGNYFASSSLGLLSDLEGLSYSWYRDSSSTVAAHLHPSLRILIDADGNLNTLGDRGGLVYEGIYNGQASAAVDTWVTTDVFTMDANMWSFGLGIPNIANGHDVNLSEWQDGITASLVDLITDDAVVIGFSSGIGSGWAGNSDFGVDTFNWKFAGQDAVMTNFEVNRTLTPVPEVSTIASASVLGVIVIAFLIRQRRATASATAL